MNADVRLKAIEKIAQAAPAAATGPAPQQPDAMARYKESRRRNRDAMLYRMGRHVETGPDGVSRVVSGTKGPAPVGGDAPSAWNSRALWDATKTFGGTFASNVGNLSSQFAASIASGAAKFNPFSLAAGLAGGLYGGLKGFANGEGFWNGAIQGGGDLYDRFNKATGLKAISRGAEDFRKSLDREYMENNNMSGDLNKNDWMQNMGILGRNMANAAGEELGAVLSFKPLSMLGRGAKAAQGAANASKKGEGAFAKGITLFGVGMNTGSMAKTDLAAHRDRAAGYLPTDENGRTIGSSSGEGSQNGYRMTYGGQDSPLYSAPNAYGQNNLPVYNGGGPGGAFTLDYGQGY